MENVLRGGVGWDGALPLCNNCLSNASFVERPLLPAKQPRVIKVGEVVVVWAVIASKEDERVFFNFEEELMG